MLCLIQLNSASSISSGARKLFKVLFLMHSCDTQIVPTKHGDGTQSLTAGSTVGGCQEKAIPGVHGLDQKVALLKVTLSVISL